MTKTKAELRSRTCHEATRALEKKDMTGKTTTMPRERERVSEKTLFLQEPDDGGHRLQHKMRVCETKRVKLYLCDPTHFKFFLK